MARKSTYQQVVESPNDTCTCSSSQRSESAAKKLRSKLLEFDAWPNIKEYKYKKLPADRQRIRLLRLLPGVLENPQIDCEIFEGEFDKDGNLLEVDEDGNLLQNDEDGNLVKIDKDGKLLGIKQMESPRKVPDEEHDDDDEPEEDFEEVEYKKRGYIRYEALSWRWGNEDDSPLTIMVKENGKLFKKRVSQTLGLALKYLRLNKDRILWIDAICINQRDLEERSYQVSMMSLVYTGSKEVCVWLGDDDDDSTLAIQFIKDEISQLKNFDRLSTDKEHATKWRALLALMQRDWFSRRWVVQEIALATKATVYCGADKISWGDLAIAVELFVEVETATHRLSELMKKDEKSALVPYWFEHISELGASVLVNATARIFREHRRGGYGALTLTREAQPSRRSLLSLEYLVTSLSIFDCGRPHDSVYALIAIARDAAPQPPTSINKRTNQALIAEVFSDALEQKPYPLDYSSSYPDVCKEFTHFCIRRCHKVDPVQALDILCRPWAKDWRPNEFKLPFPEHKPRPERLLKHKGLWMYRPNNNVLIEDKRSMGEYFEESEKKYPMRDIFIEWFCGRSDSKAHDSGTLNWPQIQAQRLDKSKRARCKEMKVQNVEDLGLPSWVATSAGAPFDIFLHPGMDMVKMGRKNADTLVAAPQDGHRNYNAGQSRSVDLETLQFRKRGRLGHYSLYVKGCRFDKVEKVAQVSQAGAIPASWLELAGWSQASRSRGPYDDPGDPPDEFWRTIVADRGTNDRNPPYYYMRACKETIMKGGLRSNAVDTGALIHNERNSIVAEFCRRVQAVIWNRALIKTRSGTLGLVSERVKVGDWICIIYGCTVPVILRKEGWKTEKELEDEKIEDCIETWAKHIRSAAKQRARKARYDEKRAKNSAWEAEVKTDLADYKIKLEELRKKEVAKHENKLKILRNELSNGQALNASGWSDTFGDVNEDPSEEEDSDTRNHLDVDPTVEDVNRKHTEQQRDDVELPAVELGSMSLSDSRRVPPKVDTQVEISPPIGRSLSAQRISRTGTNASIKSNRRASSKLTMDLPNDDTDEDRSESEEEQSRKPKNQRSASAERQRDKKRQEDAKRKDPFRYYSFLGEAYIHGMMDGDAIRQNFQKAKPDHIFEIR